MAMFRTSYASPLGQLTLYSDGEAITAARLPIWRYQPPEASVEREALPVFQQAKRCLDKYFTGVDYDDLPPLSPTGTPFQRQVWQLLTTIPRGQTRTYGDIARQLEAELGRRTSPRAVGGAVGRNPVAIFIPCHRVVGADGSLTGFGGGMDAKRSLLTLEGISCE